MNTQTNIPYISKFNDELENYLNKSPTAGDLLFYLNLSLLSGEYLFQQSEINKAKSININKVQNSYTVPKTETKEIAEIDLNLINKYLRIYADFSSNLNINLQKLCKNNFGEIVEFYLPEHLLNGILENEEEKFAKSDVSLLGNLFIINIFVADYDENLESEDWCLKKLKKLQTFLKNKSPYFDLEQPKIIFKILQSKVDYLIFKIKYRRDDKRNLCLKVENQTDIYVEENGTNIIETSHFFISKDNHFYDLYINTLKHYKKEFATDGVQKNTTYINDCKNINSEEYKNSVSKLFRYNKYLKNLENLENRDNEIEEIINDLNKQINPEKVKSPVEYFNLLSLQSALNLYKNTQFKLFLYDELEKADNVFFKAFYEEENRNLDTFLANVEKKLNENSTYLDYKKYETLFTFFDKIIENLIENTVEKFTYLDIDNLSNITEETKIDNLLEDLTLKKERTIVNIKTLRDKFQSFYDGFKKWDKNSEDLGLLPIYLENEACYAKSTIKINEKDEKDEKINLFLDSSYILPVDYSLIKRKQEEEKIQIPAHIHMVKHRVTSLYLSKINYLNILKSKLILEEKSKKIEEKIETESKKIEEDMKKGEFKTIQIVALFVTLASFVLTQVKIYENRSGIESIAISMSFAGILLLFNGFIHWMVNSNHNEKIEVEGEKVNNTPPKKWHCKFWNWIGKNKIMLSAISLILFSFLIFLSISQYGNFSSNEIKKIDTIAKKHDKSQIKDIDSLKKRDSLFQIKQKKDDSVIIKIKEAIKLK